MRGLFVIIAFILTVYIVCVSADRLNLARDGLRKTVLDETRAPIRSECGFTSCCGPRLTWAYNSELCTLTISGDGNMYNYDDDAPPWSDHSDSITTIMFEGSITSIGACAFRALTKLTTVAIPDSVNSIGQRSFSECSSLINVSLSSNVREIGDEAFASCNNLVSFIVDDGNTIFMSKDGVLFNSDGSTLVQYPCGIDTYDIPESVTTIGSYAFAGCNKLTSITIPSTVSTLGYGAFSECGNLSTVIIEPGLKSIFSESFSGCSKLSSIAIPSTVTSIEMYVFEGCSNLINVIYYGTSDPGRSSKPLERILSLHLCVPIDYKSSYFCGRDVSYVNSSSFDYLRNNPCAESIMVCGENYGDVRCSGSCGDNLNWTYTAYTLTLSGRGDMYDYENDHVPWCGCGFRQNVSTILFEAIGGEVTSIGSYAFKDFTNLSSVAIPKSVTSIGAHAFESCTSLKTIEIPPYVSSIKEQTFYKCHSLMTVISSSVIDSIGVRAFAHCSSLSSVSFAYNTREFGDCAFFECNSLTSILLSSKVKVIGSRVFAYCNNLVSINVDYGNPNFMSKDGILFNGNGSTLIHYPCGINNDTYFIPESVTTIGSDAFIKCGKLTSITIPSTVNTMESYAFSVCSNLTKVTIEPGLTSIGDYAFGWCEKLASITIPSTVTSIQSGAFGSCDELMNVTYFGTRDPGISSKPLGQISSLKYLCVPIDYNSYSFCGKNISYVTSPSFYYLRKYRNPCTDVMVCSEDYVDIRRSLFASEWEDQTTECVEYKCTDDNVPITENLCKSTNETSLVCMNDKCVDNNTLNDVEGFVVEIQLENATNFTMDEIIESISIITGIDKDEMRIGTETNEDGQILRVFVIVNDKGTANKVVKSIDDVRRDCALSKITTSQ